MYIVGVSQKCHRLHYDIHSNHYDIRGHVIVTARGREAPGETRGPRREAPERGRRAEARSARMRAWGTKVGRWQAPGHGPNVTATGPQCHSERAECHSDAAQCHSGQATGQPCAVIVTPGKWPAAPWCALALASQPDDSSYRPGRDASIGEAGAAGRAGNRRGLEGVRGTSPVRGV